MWIATTSDTQGTFGSTGNFWVFGTVNPAESVTLPERLNMTTQRSSFAKWTRGGKSRTYIAGSATDNLVFTEHMGLYRVGIEAPTNPIVVTATPANNEVGVQAIAGGGLTGNIIVYLRFYDSLNDRRSPLSGPSPIIALAAQGVELENVPNGPDSIDSGVTHVEVWASQDGGLPRFWFRRDVGAPVISGNVTSLAEAEQDTLDLLPRCKFNKIYHDRSVWAGDDRHPDRLYFSVSEEPELYAGLWISTRQGEPIIGLFVVRDVLIVQCPTIHYVVTGYDENDIEMNVLEPYIGGLGHHTMTSWNDQVVIPGTLDWYLCDGGSMTPLGAGVWDETWRRSIANADYTSNTWAMTDLSAGVVKFCVRDQNVSIYGYPKTSPQEYFSTWILDLRGDVPDLMFDIHSIDTPAGAQLALPGYTRPQSYIASGDGIVYLENQYDQTDVGGVEVNYRINTSHQVVVDPIDNSDCVRFVKTWIVVQNEYNEVTADIYAGNEYAWRGENPSDSLTIPAQLLEREIGGSDVLFVANDRTLNGLARSAGSAVSMDIRCSAGSVNPPFPLSQQPNPGPFVFKGWGVDFSGDGEQFRPSEVTLID
jgi:hypothetical protein